MNAYANKDLRMPAHYVDMSEKEMEYDGGRRLFGTDYTSRVIAGALLGGAFGCYGGVFGIAVGALGGAGAAAVDYCIEVTTGKSLAGYIDRLFGW